MFRRITSPNDYIQKLSGSGTKIGSSITLKVMAGDKVNIKVSSWYKKSGASPGTPVNTLPDLLTALINGVGGSAAPVHGGTIGTQLQTNAVLTPGATQFLSSQTVASGKPKAFLNWVLFDEQFKLVSTSSSVDPVGDDDVFKSHVVDGIVMNKSGYLYVYVSNETPNIHVFFDNLQVTHVKGPVMEETHYYPFGLTMAGISSKTFQSSSPDCGCPSNKKGYNGNEIQNKEFSDGSGLEVYDFNARTYDQQIGRFIQIDPLANQQNQESFTPYHFSYNNPSTFNDPTGQCPSCIGAAVGAVGGFIYGAFKFGFKNGNWKKVLATTGAGAVGGATLGLGGSFIATAGGVSALGAANVAMATGATSIVSAAAANLTDQGLSMVLGVQDKFDGQELAYSMTLAVPESLLSSAVTDPLKNSIKSELSNAITDNAISTLSAKERGQIVKSISKKLRNELGSDISRKNSKIAAEKIVNLMEKSETEILRVGIKIVDKGVQVSGVIVDNAINDKNREIINQ